MILRIKPLLEDGKLVGAACLDCGGPVFWDSKGETVAPRCLAEEKLLGDFLTLEALLCDTKIWFLSQKCNGG